MKRIILFTLMVFFFNVNIYGQNPNQPFVGTWQWVNGNQIFQVELRLDSQGDIEGDFLMIQTNGNGLAPTIIYKSNKDIGHGLTWGPVIFANSINGTKMGGGLEIILAIIHLIGFQVN